MLMLQTWAKRRRKDLGRACLWRSTSRSHASSIDNQERVLPKTTDLQLCAKMNRISTAAKAAIRCLRAPVIAHGGRHQSTSTSTPTKVLTDALARSQPRFSLDGDSIRILNSPRDFYNTLIVSLSYGTSGTRSDGTLGYDKARSKANSPFVVVHWNSRDRAGKYIQPCLRLILTESPSV